MDKKPAVDWIRESNLIENVDSIQEDSLSLLAWEWLQKQDWNLKTILGLHKRIMNNFRPDIAGKIRTCEVCVGSTQMPHCKKVPGLLKTWIKKGIVINNELTKKQSAPFIKQSHIEFEGIHPFVDGNGRVGRMLMNWQRVRAGLEPLLIKASERQNYYKWFKRNGKK